MVVLTKEGSKLMGILDDLRETQEYFEDPDNGADAIGAHACRDAIGEISRLQATISQMRQDFRRIQMMSEQHCPADNFTVPRTED